MELSETENLNSGTVFMVITTRMWEIPTPLKPVKTQDVPDFHFQYKYTRNGPPDATLSCPFSLSTYELSTLCKPQFFLQFLMKHTERINRSGRVSLQRIGFVNIVKKCSLSKKGEKL